MRFSAERLPVLSPEFVLPFLWALMASAMIVESDVYRYVTIGLSIWVLVRHSLAARQVSEDWLAMLCYAWSAYVLLRFAAGIILYDEKGSSEWLYAYPALFPLMGVALKMSRAYLFRAATLVLVCGLIAFLATLDLGTTLTGLRAPPLFHHNPIHAGIGSAMLFISSVAWLLYLAETDKLTPQVKWPFLLLGIATAILSLLGVLTAQSKGAWLALLVTVALWPLVAIYHLSGRWRTYAAAAIAVSTVGAVLLALPYIEGVAGPTMEAGAALVGNAVVGEDPADAFQSAVEAGETPESMRARLMLWMNAVELISERPLLGWGNLWLAEWRQTTYASVGFNLLHNGYLEILVRHGLLGFGVLAIFVATGIRRLNEAVRNGTVAASAALYIYSLSFFFFCTILTNSNNRLALGESYFILAGAAVFAVTLLKKDNDRAIVDEASPLSVHRY